jgi:hypothetical protein
MTVREQLKHALDELSEGDLQEVADYLAFLKFRCMRSPRPRLDPEDLAAMYDECAEEDRRVAEQGMQDYVQGLRREDKA